MGVLTRVFPPGLVDEVIAGSGRTEVRSRRLPARVMAYFAIGMALYSAGSYEDVLSQLSDGLAWASGWEQEYVLPSKSAIFQARARLGAKPLQALFERVAHPIATAPTAGETAPGWVAGRRLVAVDGTCLDLADTAENEAFFGRPGVNKGEQSAFPQARVVALAECGTHAIFAAVVGPLTTGEPTMMEQLLPKVQPGMLLLADRGAFSYALWRKASETGADLLWRIRTDRAGPQPSHLEDLPDGSWLAELRRSTGAAERAKPTMMVRVIDYTVEDGREHPSYRLFTTILDPAEATAAELAAAYQRRWEIELAFDEIETHQRGPAAVLRSRTPDMVLQELYGLLVTHYAIRKLMAEAADQAELDPDRLSFTRTLNIVRRQVTAQAGLSPLTTGPRDG